MDEKMADEAPSHIWKKFISLLASAGHGAFAGGLIWCFKAKARVRTELYLCRVFIGLLKCIVKFKSLSSVTLQAYVGVRGVL